MTVTTIAISQPTFLPWAGWFDLADQVDLLIELDDVSFSKRSWQQRNRIRTREGLSSVTVPVLSAGRRRPTEISDTELAGPGFRGQVCLPALFRAKTIADAQYYSRYFG